MKKVPESLIEEKEITEKSITSIKYLSKKEIINSYFLRDLSICLLEKKSINVETVLFKLKELGINSISKKDLENSIDLWHGDSSVQAYRTPKLLLYTIRGDYPLKTIFPNQGNKNLK